MSRPSWRSACALLAGSPPGWWSRRGVRLPSGLEAGERLLGVSVRWEDGIDDAFNRAVTQEQGEALEQRDAVDLKGGEAEHGCELKPLVRKQRVGQVQPLGGFLLVGSVLGGEAEEPRAGRGKAGVLVAEGARLRSAAAGAGNRIPRVVAAGRGLAGDGRYAGRRTPPRGRRARRGGRWCRRWPAARPAGAPCRRDGRRRRRPPARAGRRAAAGDP